MKKPIAGTIIVCSLILLRLPSTQAEEIEPWFTPTPTPALSSVDAPITTSYGSIGSDAQLLNPSITSANPANCTTTALWPHESSHLPGTINAGVQQKCPIPVVNNSVEAKLWEKRWWGYNIIDGPRYSDLGTRKISTVYVNAACRTNSIRVTGYGHYEWMGIHVVSSEVSKTVDIDC